jgi:hypothetical protein
MLFSRQVLSFGGTWCCHLEGEDGGGRFPQSIDIYVPNSQRHIPGLRIISKNAIITHTADSLLNTQERVASTFMVQE